MAGGKKFKTVVFHLHDSDGYGRNNDKPFVVQALNNNSVQNQPGMEWTTSLLNVILHLRATCVRLRPPSRHRSTTTPCPFLLQWNNVLLRLHGPSGGFRKGHLLVSTKHLEGSSVSHQCRAIQLTHQAASVKGASKANRKQQLM